MVGPDEAQDRPQVHLHPLQSAGQLSALPQEFLYKDLMHSEAKHRSLQTFLQTF